MGVCEKPPETDMFLFELDIAPVQVWDSPLGITGCRWIGERPRAAPQTYLPVISEEITKFVLKIIKTNFSNFKTNNINEVITWLIEF